MVNITLNAESIKWVERWMKSKVKLTPRGEENRLTGRQIIEVETEGTNKRVDTKWRTGGRRDTLGRNRETQTAQD